MKQYLMGGACLIAAGLLATGCMFAPDYSNVAPHIDPLYRYLKARADGVLPAGRPARTPWRRLPAAQPRPVSDHARSALTASTQGQQAGCSAGQQR